jgi:hypothetical protein
MNHWGQTAEAEKSLTLRAYAQLHKQTYKQTTEDIAIVLNASCQSVGHVLGMMAKRGLILRESIADRKFWTLPADPYSFAVVAATMNKVESAKLAKVEIATPRKVTIRLVQLEPMLPPPTHPLDQAWKIIYEKFGAVSRSLAPPVPDQAGPDAGLAPDSGIL